MPSAESVSPVVNCSHPKEENHSGPYDLVCVGFGPASLAIAIALRDKNVQARVLYLERQKRFKWHGGMLLPDTRMQISFLKDLATLRDPRSEFTFLNYLKQKKRLVAFTNLSTFLPLREEYNDYLTWCASHFDENVYYGQEALSISPLKGPSGKIEHWQVESQNLLNGKTLVTASRHIVVAVGGRPKIPQSLSDTSVQSKIIHSSSYSTIVPKMLAGAKKSFHIAIIGGGQSAVEIFNDLSNRSPSTRLSLYTGDSALRPSDDSPFVNEIFDPDRVDEFFDLPSEKRHETLMRNRATNYGVVRNELLDQVYQKLYFQRLREPDERSWPHRIVTSRSVQGYEKQNNPEGLRLRLLNTTTGEIDVTDDHFDLVIAATGYQRDVHETLLKPSKHLLETGKYDTERNYRVRFRQGTIADNCGIWLQGCCEESHGLSDTLLSILAIRGGAMVDNLFPRLENGDA